VLLDGVFGLYLPVLELLEPHLRPGSPVIAENAVEQSTGYLGHVRDPGNGYPALPLPFEAGRGNQLIRLHPITSPSAGGRPAPFGIKAGRRRVDVSSEAAAKAGSPPGEKFFTGGECASGGL
jgi:hypothetical protein